MKEGACQAKEGLKTSYPTDYLQKFTHRTISTAGTQKTPRGGHQDKTRHTCCTRREKRRKNVLLHEMRNITRMVKNGRDESHQI